jgi:hypothetical protein
MPQPHSRSRDHDLFLHFLHVLHCEIDRAGSRKVVRQLLRNRCAACGETVARAGDGPTEEGVYDKAVEGAVRSALASLQAGTAPPRPLPEFAGDSALPHG